MHDSVPKDMQSTIFLLFWIKMLQRKRNYRKWAITFRKDRIGREMSWRKVVLRWVAVWKKQSWGGYNKKCNINNAIFALLPVEDIPSTTMQRWDSAVNIHSAHWQEASAILVKVGKSTQAGMTCKSKPKMACESTEQSLWWCSVPSTGIYSHMAQPYEENTENLQSNCRGTADPVIMCSAGAMEIQRGY